MSGAGARIIEGAKEAVAIAKGERPAARLHVNGHAYIPDASSILKAARIDRGRESRFMAAANDWVMVRRHGCIPYTIPLKDWVALPLASKRGD